MGFQIGGTVLDFIVLGILRRQDEYGYILTQEVRSILDVSETALYPALRRLKNAGLLTAYDRPFQGRNRRYYRLTEAGRQALSDYEAEWSIFHQKMDRLLKGDTP